MPAELTTYGSLFTGIGGFDLAADRAGLHCAWQCEIHKPARRVLERHWPGVMRPSDIRTFNNAPKVDLVVAGFPCQDLSIAGKRKGLAGERSGLYWDMLRVIDECAPAYVVWENVPGLASADCGRDFGRVLLSLAERGYFGAGRIVDAQYFGVAQQRRRWFGVFARRRSGARFAAEVLSLRSGLQGHPAPGRQAREAIVGPLAARTRSGGGPGTDGAASGQLVATTLTTRAYADQVSREANLIPDVCGTLDTRHSENGHVARGATVQDACSNRLIPALSMCLTTGTSSRYDAGTETMLPVAYRTSPSDGVFLQGNKVASLATFTDPTQQIIHEYDGVRRLMPIECERLQGFPDGWTEGLSDAARYHGLGNAVAVPCAEWVLRSLVKCHMSLLQEASQC